MNTIDVTRRWPLWPAIGAAALLVAAGAGPAIAAPPISGAATQDAGQLKARINDVNAELATARSAHDRLESQLARMEQRNDASRQQLQQRDAQIAALRARLKAAGVPASAASS